MCGPTRDFDFVCCNECEQLFLWTDITMCWGCDKYMCYSCCVIVEEFDCDNNEFCGECSKQFIDQ
jgi:hypothetical protein